MYFYLDFEKQARKSNNSLVKNVYSCGTLVQSLAKDQIMIKHNSIGILTFLKQSNLK